MNVRMCGPFPPEICPFPLKNGGFPTLPPVLPVYPGFSIILSPYTDLRRFKIGRNLKKSHKKVGVMCAGKKPMWSK